MDIFALVKCLGSENFTVRESAELSLIRLYPLSRGAILIGSQSADPEIRNRCIDIDKKGAYALFGKQGRIFIETRKRMQHEERIKWLWKVQPEFVNFGMVDFCLEDKTDKRMHALYLILCPFESEGLLPSLPKQVYDEYVKSPELIIGLRELVDYIQSRLTKKTLIVHRGNGPYVIYQINNIRLWVRGLIGGAANATHWNQIKDKKYKDFDWK